MSAVSILHKFHGIQCLAIESFLVKAVLKGYRRMLGHTMVQKLPITPDMLKRIISICDKKNESGFIAAILVGFFTFLRKSNLVPESMENFKPGRHLSRGSFAFKGDCGVVKVVETKTIQCRERILYLPLAKGSVTELCPIAAVQVHFLEFITKDKSDPAFQYKGRDGTRTLTHSKLSSTLNEKLTILGIDPNTISMHSLRRGGASYAHQCGASIELMQAMGDWASLSVLLYLSRPFEQRLNVATTMANNI